MPSASRLRLALWGATLAVGVSTMVALPAGAAGVVGGPRLGTRGVVVASDAPPLPAGISAAGWVLADLDTGDVLAARNPHGRYLPASTLKMLTAVTLIPRVPRLEMLGASNKDISVEGSKVGLVPGVRYRADQLFTALLVVSGNDAANALASAAGGPARTVALMNAEAHRLRATDTVARTPSGLDAPGQHSSAYDLALIARAGMTMPDFRRYVATRMSYIPAPGGRRFQVYTHNRLLLHYSGAVGIKNGFTVAARASFVGAATRGGHTLVVALMRANPTVWKEAAALLSWGFAARSRVTPVGRLVAPVGADPAEVAAADGGGRAAALHHRNAAAPTRRAGMPLPATAAGAAVLMFGLLLLARVRVVRRRRRRRRRLRSAAGRA